MSNYCRIKSIMYPISEELLKELGLKDWWELSLKVGELRQDKNDHYFDVEPMIDYSDNWKSAEYLSFILYFTYGKECGDFGWSRFLTSSEQEKYKKIFEQVLPTVDTSKLKYVDYCYYNACESSDYYKHGDNLSDSI